MDDVTVLPHDRILAFGDSLTEGAGGTRDWSTEPATGNGWLAQLTRLAQGPDRAIEFANRGVGGNKVGDLLDRVQAEVIEAEPTLVILWIGVNDVWHWRDGQGTSEDDYRNGLRSLVRRLHEDDLRVLLCTPSVIGEQLEGANAQDAMLTTYVGISAEIAADEGAALCDLHTAFRDELARVNADDAADGVLTTDGVHLSDAGSELVAATVASALDL